MSPTHSSGIRVNPVLLTFMKQFLVSLGHNTPRTKRSEAQTPSPFGIQSAKPPALPMQVETKQMELEAKAGSRLEIQAARRKAIAEILSHYGLVKWKRNVLTHYRIQYGIGWLGATIKG
jgi:hypothetical protein